LLSPPFLYDFWQSESEIQGKYGQIKIKHLFFVLI